MPFLSPAKLLVIVVIGLVVLGPDKLPKVAKQIGGLWADFRRFRQQLESDVRNSFPDLPSTDELAHAVRSPLSFLNTLADSHGTQGEASSTESPEPGAAPEPSPYVEPPGHGEDDDRRSGSALGAVACQPDESDRRQGVFHESPFLDDGGLN